MDNAGYINDNGRNTTTEDAKKQSIAEPTSTSNQDDNPICSSDNLKSTLAQCFATFVNSLAYISLGLMYTIPTVVIGKVQNAREGLSLNEEQASWYASFLPISQPFGCLLGGFLQNYIGRKQGLLLMNVSTVVAWVLLYKAVSVQMLYVSSILMGVSIGFSEAPSITYVCEIATPKLRGSLVTYHTANVLLGLVLTFLLTSFVSWRTTCLFCVGLSVFSILMLFFIPDSPIWLINKGRMTEAIRALRWLRGWVPEEQVIAEFDELNRYIQGSYFETAIKQSSDGSSFDKRRHQGFKMSYLFDKCTLRPFILLFCFSSFGFAASAMGAKNSYIVILNSLNLPMDSNSLCLLNGAALLVGSLVCFLTVKKFGKRTLALTSMISSSILALLLGFYIMFENKLHLPSIFIVLFTLHGFTQSVGIYCTIPWVLLGEVYPVKTRSVASGITGAAYYFSLFVYFKTYYYLELWLTTPGTFILYGVIGIIGFVYVWILMPETEGKTMAEIGELFKDDARNSCPHFRKKK